MDSFAIGLKVAAKLIEDKVIDNILDERYASFKTGIGADIVAGKANFKTLEEYALNNSEIKVQSGRLERVRDIINQYLLSVE